MATEDQVISILKEIVDPHTNMSIYDMGLISDLVVSGHGVSLTFRPTSPFCPLGIQFAMNIKRRLVQLEGVDKAEVTVVGHMQEDYINRELSTS